MLILRVIQDLNQLYNLGAERHLVLFSIGRGHDGPARVGLLKLNEHDVPTPALISPMDGGLAHFYATYNHESFAPEKPILLSLGSAFMWDFESSLDNTEDMMVLLPSFPGLSDISDSSKDAVLQFQLEIIERLSDTLDPSQLVARIPATSNPNALSDVVSKISEKGVTSAAITFDSTSGMNDYNSIFMRAHLPRSWSAFAFGRITPSVIPLLYYVGFDFFDIGYGWASASQNIRLWSYEQERITNDATSRFCGCTACNQSIQLNELDNTKANATILQHNILVYRTVMSECLHHSKRGSLRQLVESFTHASPSLNALLRTIDQGLYDYLEEFTPTSGSGTQSLIGPESYHAPSIRRFREYLKDRYIPPSHKSIILLLPCSARKPYSDSKSHRRFISTIESALGSLRSRVAETILTSPLGVIPRELERIYPAANYDIPVTGDWDDEEVSIGADALVAHLNKFDEACVVVAHVQGGYKEIVASAQERIRQSVIYTLDEQSPGSRDGLQSLRDTLTDLKEILQLENIDSRLFADTLRATADFQFGPDAGMNLIPDSAKLSGKLYRMVVVRDGGVQTCAFIASNGLLSLTIDGGRKIDSLERYWVRFAGEDIQGGSLFAIGVKEADERIRPGDEVVILNNSGKLLAVGRSEMSGLEMCEHTRGRAVTIRHKVGE